MLDLNIDAAHSGGSSPSDDEIDWQKTPTADSVASTNTSTTNNEVDCNSSTLNFSILNKDVFEIEDDARNDVVNYWNELQLFPVSVSPPSPTPAIIRANYWLNLSAQEVASSAVGGGRGVVQPPPAKKSRRGPRSRSSQYRGVTFYRRTGRWESHIWDCSKQVYLGGFDTAHAAARAYDRAAIKFRGVDADINFTISDYEEDMKLLKNLTKEEFVLVLRRQSNGSARGNSKYRGLTLHKYGRWEPQMGQFFGKNAYDKAAMNCNGREAVTNFELSNYGKEMNISSGNGGNDSCLDLSLGISLSSDGSKGNRSKVEPPQELVSTKYPPTWAGIYSCFGPNSKELATRMSGEAVSSPGFSLNWPWKMSVLASSAASSGFSPATSPYMASVAPFTSQPQLP